MNTWSLLSRPLKIMYFNHQNEREEVLAHATIFVVKYNDCVYLVTNKHNLTQRNVFNNEVIAPNGVVEISKLIVTLLLPVSNSNNNITYEFSHLVLYPENFIYNKTDSDDIAICPLDALKHIFQRIIHLIPSIERSPLLSVGTKLIVAGYPDRNNLNTPLYRSAQVANEQTVNISLDKNQNAQCDNIVLLDGVTNSGQSGSPVLIHREDFESNSFNDRKIFSSKMADYVLYGIYSGRYCLSNSESVYLGICWPSQYIVKILDNFVGEVNES